jgi:hypothetical protein
MKRLREMIFDDSSLSNDEEEGDEVKIAMAVRLGSRFGRLYINRGRVEGHIELMRDYFNPDLSGEVFSQTISDAQESFLCYCKSHEES